MRWLAYLHQMPRLSLPGLGPSLRFLRRVLRWRKNDIKRILAYSTVSQLGYMMMGLGVGGVAVGMFHLITHAFFKALAESMGAGLGDSTVVARSRTFGRMGGLRSRYTPMTFATYAVGMLALCGLPVCCFRVLEQGRDLSRGATAGRWRRRAILSRGRWARCLTAFYMTRQVFYVFFIFSFASWQKTTASERRTVDRTRE